MLNPAFATDAELGHYDDDSTVEAHIALFTHGVSRRLIAPTADLPKSFITEKDWEKTYFQIGELLKEADFLLEELGYFAEDEKELAPEQYEMLNKKIATGLASLLEARDKHEKMHLWGE